MSVCCKRKTVDGIATEDEIIVSGSTTTADLTVTDTASFADGTASDPSITFTSDPDTGLYKQATDSIGFTTGGTKRRHISTTTEDFTLPQRGGTGSDAIPTYSFGVTPTTGIYSPGSNQIGFSTDATLRHTISATAETVTLPLTITDTTASTSDTTGALIVAGGIGATNGVVVADGNTQGYRFTGGGDITGAAGLIIIQGGTAGGNDVRFLTSGGMSMSGFTQQISASLGTALLPGYAFNTDANTGMYQAGADTLGFTTAGTVRKTISTALETSILPVSITDTTATSSSSTGALVVAGGIGAAGGININNTPGLMFSGGAGTITAAGGGNILINAGGTENFRVNSTGLVMSGNTQQIFASRGTALLPGLSFNNDPNTGMYWAGADQLGLTSGGVHRMSVATELITLGTVAYPTNDTNGVYRFGNQSKINREFVITSTGVQTATFTVTVASGLGAVQGIGALKLVIAGVQDNGALDGILNYEGSLRKVVSASSAWTFLESRNDFTADAPTVVVDVSTSLTNQFAFTISTPSIATANYNMSVSVDTMGSFVISSFATS